MHLLQRVSMQHMTAAGFTGHGGIRSILDDMKLLSTEAEGVSEVIDDDRRGQFVNDAGRVGALLGLKSSEKLGAARESTCELHHNIVALLVPPCVHAWW